MKLRKMAVLLGVVGSMAASSYAWSASYWYDQHYFNDPGRTQWVGEKITGCDGRVTMIGSVGIYGRKYTHVCTSPTP
jgi:hypothetical protein